MTSEGTQRALSLDEIHELEFRDSYPAAIVALEQRLVAHPDEEETVVRLGFNYWLIAEEGDRIDPSLPTEQYAEKFMELFRAYESEFSAKPDFCFAFGLGMSLFWWLFPGATERKGKTLLRQAARLDPFYRRMITPITWFAKWRWRSGRHPSHEELAQRFSGRGVLARYYGVD